MNDRLPARLEATALMRQVESNGGFGTLVRRGDPDRGALLLLVAERGRTVALVERQMTADFSYRWSRAEAGDGPDAEKFLELANRRVRFDPDCWVIELDVPDAERFIAETIVSP